MGEPRPVDWIEACDLLSPDETTAILSSNAANLFGLDRVQRIAAPIPAVA
jgi:hypothetical protein